MKKLYTKVLVILLTTISAFTSVKAQNPVLINGGQDILLPCGINCTNIPVSLASMPSVATNTYSVSNISYAGNYGPYNVGTNYQALGDDDFGPSIPLPFTFCFYGQNYNNVVLGSNGIITFNTALAGAFCPWGVGAAIPSGNYADYSVMADYTDLHPVNNADKIKYQTQGVAPNRRFIVNYNAIGQFGNTGTTANFQIVLFETTNIVEVYIQLAPNASTTMGQEAIVGIQRDNTTALAAPGRNSVNWQVLNTVPSPSEAWRWTPTGGTSGGAPLSVNLYNINGLLVQPGVVVPNPPNYAATFTNICPTADTTSYVVEASYITCAGNTIFKDTVRIIKTVTPPPTVNSPVVYCQYATAVPLTANGSNLLWYTQAVGGIGSPIAPTPSTSTAATYTWWVSQTLNGCESVRVPINVVINPTPSITANSNSPICAGGQLNLTSTFVPGATYQWNGPNFFNATIQNPTINGAQPINAGTYTVTASIVSTVGSTQYTCTSAPATTVVQVLPNPFIAFASAQSATTCTGTGQITLSGLTPNTLYVVHYTFNGNPVTVNITSSVAGQVIITGLAPGTYTAIYVTLGNCNSNTMNGPYTINNPPVGATITETHISPTTCGGTNGSITIGGINNASAYTLYYTFNGTPLTANIPTGNGGSYVLGGLSAGTYTNIYVVLTANNCQSNTIAQVILNNPPTPTVNVTSTNPTSCTLNNGSITISGLTPGSTYQLTYIANGTPVTTNIGPIGGGGTHTITGLAGGTYSNITVTVVATNCSSTPVTINLVGPSAPPAPAITANGPALCAGQTFTAYTTATGNGMTYTWSGPGGFSSTDSNIVITNIQTNQSGVYTLTVTSNNCTSAPSIYNLTVNPSPAKPNAGPDLSICEGQAINLTASTTTPGVTWSWTSTTPFTSTLQNPNVTNSAAAANSGSYYVVASAAGCPSIPDTVNVTVTPTPAIQFTSTNPTACATNTGSITLNGLVTGSQYTYTYTKNGGTPTTGGPVAATGGAITISNLGAGTYTNISVTLNGCQSNIVGPVSLVDPNAPAAPVPTSNTPICVGDALNLTVSPVAGGTFVWNGPNGFNDSTQNPTINNAGLTAAGTYTVYVVVNSCTSPTATTLVVVNPIPATPNLTGTTTQLCEGDAISLVCAPINGVNYQWDGPNAFTSPNQNETIPNAQTNMSGTYTMTVTNGTCDASNTVDITVNPIPLPPVGTDVEVCQNVLYQLTAQGQNLLWYNAATGGIGYPTMNANTGTAGVTTCYYVSQTVNGCESPRRSVCVYVKPQPVPPVAQTSYTYCQFDVATQLTATGNNLLWYDQSQVQLPGAPTPNTSVAGGQIYYVTQTDSGCESNKTQINVLINAKPAMPSVEQVTICQDEAAPGLVAQGQGLLWYDAATGGTGSATTPTVSTADTGTFDYYVSQTVNGCESDRALLRVTVNPKVVAEFITDKDTVCDSYPLTVTFTGQAPDGASYDWNFDQATEVTGSGAGPYTVTWDQKGPKTITLTVTNLNCTSTLSKTIMVLETPDPNFAIQPDACLNEEIRVQAAYNQMDLPGYSWNFGDAQVLEGSGYGPYTLKWTTTGQKVISMSLTNIPCPSLRYYDTINIHHPEAKVMNRSENEICTSDSVLFTAQPGLDYQYQWTPAVYFGEETNSLSMWGIVKSKGYATLTVTDRWGCQAQDSVLVEPKSCCEVFLPNTFTPNGDGKNDVFRLVTKGNQEISVFIIMDRWGKRMFESINQYEAWDGSYNGEPQDMGTYQYYLRYRCADTKEIVEMKGDVILLR